MLDLNKFTTENKKSIEADIQMEFNVAYEGILMLPKDARFGVYLASTAFLFNFLYYYYFFGAVLETSNKVL